MDPPGGLGRGLNNLGVLPGPQKYVEQEPFKDIGPLFYLLLGGRGRALSTRGCIGLPGGLLMETWTVKIGFWGILLRILSPAVCGLGFRVCWEI